MSLRNLSCGFCALITLAAGSPALANPQNNSPIVVDITSNTTINGNGNSATNSNNQNVRDSGPTRGAAITVRSNQACNIVGDGNNCTNRSSQSVEATRRR
jgi:hypothetical protein